MAITLVETPTIHCPRSSNDRYEIVQLPTIHSPSRQHGRVITDVDWFCCRQSDNDLIAVRHEVGDPHQNHCERTTNPATSLLETHELSMRDPVGGLPHCLRDLPD
jgi:hypothetical protein